MVRDVDDFYSCERDLRIGMFANTAAFNQPLERWNVGAVTDMFQMFFGAAAFNQPLERWNVEAVTTMQGMFTNSGIRSYPNWYKR